MSASQSESLGRLAAAGRSSGSTAGADRPRQGLRSRAQPAGGAGQESERCGRGQVTCADQWQDSDLLGRAAEPGDPQVAAAAAKPGEAARLGPGSGGSYPDGSGCTTVTNGQHSDVVPPLPFEPVKTPCVTCSGIVHSDYTVGLSIAARIDSFRLCSPQLVFFSPVARVPWPHLCPTRSGLLLCQ